MPPYHCCFLDENDEVDRVQALGASNDTDAYGEAMRLTTEIGRVSGFEVWHRGNKVHTYKPAKSQSRARGQTYSGYLNRDIWLLNRKVSVDVVWRGAILATVIGILVGILTAVVMIGGVTF